MSFDPVNWGLAAGPPAPGAMSFDFGNVAGTAMQVAGTLFTAGAQRDDGRERMAAAESQAAQMRENAMQQEAAGQRGASEQRRKAKLLQSRALAIAAAGGGASDPSVINLIADIEGEGAYRAAVEMFDSGESARQMRNQAAMTQYEGQAAYRAAKTDSLSTIFKGATGIFSKYAGDMVGKPAAKTNLAESYRGTWTASGPFDPATYDKQIWD